MSDFDPKSVEEKLVYVPRTLYQRSGFPGETRIQTPFGERRIDSIKRGDYILSWNAARQEMVKRRVKKVIVHPPTQLSQISFNGMRNPLFVARGQTLFMNQGWKQVAQLTKKDYLLLVGEGELQWAHITNVEETKRIKPVYRLITEGEHNFIAEGHVAHNFRRFRKLKTCADRFDGFVRNILAGSNRAALDCK
jgi:hypothetical protein